MTIKNEKLTLQDVESMCKLAHEHSVAIDITVRTEYYDVNISPWVPTRVESSTKITDDAPVAIRQVDVEELEKMMGQSIDIVRDAPEVSFISQSEEAEEEQ